MLGKVFFTGLFFFSPFDYFYYALSNSSGSVGLLEKHWDIQSVSVNLFGIDELHVVAVNFRI